MAKRKYTTYRETPVAFECTKRACKWKGTDQEKNKSPRNFGHELTCPNCGNNEFYGLLEKPEKNANSEN